MDLFYVSQINKCEQKMAGYLALLNFRYQNLCVKAEPTSLVPVSVMFGAEEKNIEEVADIAQPDDYHLAVIPKTSIVTTQITKGIFTAHPEFKLAVKKMDVLGDEKEYLEYEMPEVNKDRRDFLNTTVKSLHEEAKARIDKIHSETKVSFADFLNSKPEDLDEVNAALDKAHEDYLDKLKNLRDNKLEEVEDGYQRYLAKVAEKEGNGGDTGYDVTKGMRMKEE